MENQARSLSIATEDESMNSAIVQILMFSLLMAVDDSKTDLDTIEGTWVLLRMEKGARIFNMK